MADPLAGQEPEETAPAENPPAAPAPDIEQRLAQMQQSFEDRIKGFQRALNDKEAAIKAREQELQELRMSGMTEDEKAELQWSQLERENNELKQQNLLLSLAPDYPDELPIFLQILKGSEPKEQLEVIRAIRKAATAPQPQATPAEGEPEIPPVDSNNPLPARPVESDNQVMFNGRVVDENWADHVLHQFQRMRQG